MPGNFVKIDEALKKLIVMLGYSDLMEKFDVFRAFEEVLGNTILEFVKIKNYDKGILVLEIEDPAWKNEVFYMREDIKDKINQSLKKEAIKQIRIL